MAGSDPLKVAPSEEFVLHCDVQWCPARLAMISGVTRESHGWGRMSVYLNQTGETEDYDLCPRHVGDLRRLLAGK